MALDNNSISTPLSSASCSDWLSPIAIASEYGVAPNTVRRLVDSNRLPARVLPSGHRRILRSDAEALFAIKNVKQTENVHSQCVIYARVSTSRQSKGFGNGSENNDLARQIGRLKETAKQQFNCENPTIYSDTGSGLSENRKSYNRLIENLLAGKHDGATLLITHKDRLSRFSPEIFLKLCQAHNVEVVFTEAEETKEQADELARDVVMIIQVYGARICASRSSARSKVLVDEADLRQIFLLFKSGHSTREIEKILKQEGKLSTQQKPIGRTAIRRLLKDNAKILDEVMGGDTKNSFQEFEAQYIRRGSDGLRLSKKRIVELYRALTFSPFLGPCGMREFSSSCILQRRTGSMKRNRYTEEQIAFALRQHEAGTPVPDIVRKMGIAEQTFYRWKKKYAGLGIAELRRLKQLEDENKKLKQLVADLSLDKKMLQDVVQGKA